MTALSTEAVASPRLFLQVLPAPVSVPPYDDEPGPRPVLRLVTTPVEEAPELDDDAWISATRTATAALPPAKPVVQALVHGLLEVLAGVRGVTQLRRDTTPDLYVELAETISTKRGGTTTRPGLRDVRSLHLQVRPEGIVEACATVVRGGRHTALALRLEGFEGRWLCTQLVGV